MSADRGRGALRGVGGRGNSSPPSDMREAGRVRAQAAPAIYASENRDRAHDQVRTTRPDLAAILDSHDPESESYCNAENEVWDLGNAMLRQEYAALSSSAKEFYEQQEKENQANAWRRVRAQGKLIESEASLRQKAEDDRLIAAGAPAEQFNGYGRGRGGGRGRGALPMHLGGGAMGGIVFTQRQNFIPPFDVTTKTLKAGVLRNEEYF